MAAAQHMQDITLTQCSPSVLKLGGRRPEEGQEGYERKKGEEAGAANDALPHAALGTWTSTYYISISFSSHPLTLVTYGITQHLFLPSAFLQ